MGQEMHLVSYSVTACGCRLYVLPTAHFIVWLVTQMTKGMWSVMLQWYESIILISLNQYATVYTCRIWFLIGLHVHIITNTNVVSSLYLCVCLFMFYIYLHMQYVCMLYVCMLYLCSAYVCCTYVVRMYVVRIFTEIFIDTLIGFLIDLSFHECNIFYAS